ncbi:hypothetical protein CPB86DRAFT_782329 [Serendipita vermifera]|nr:hypothetical protein CPB86DRAFT_782329 [Serendipita vermifera]
MSLSSCDRPSASCPELDFEPFSPASPTIKPYFDQLAFLELQSCTERLRAHKSECEELLSFSQEHHERLKEQAKWQGFVRRLCDSLKAWSQLDELDILMKFDSIYDQLASMKIQLAEFGIETMSKPESSNVVQKTKGDVLASVLALLECPDGVERLENLPPSSLQKAMEIFERALASLSLASPYFHDVRAGLIRLQVADSTVNLEATDLTPNISDISDEPFAKGGFSDVYAGVWLKQDKVALKILRILGGSGTTKRHKLFRREVKLWHSLRHPHLLQFWGLCNTPQGLAMVSPFMYNGNAAAYLAAHPESGALNLLVGAAHGLEYLHTRQPPITHGDLRGANILVSAAGEACLADFGLSKIMEAASVDTSVGMTTANAGATRWMAPELFHAESSDYPPSCPSPRPGHASLDTREDTLTLGNKRSSEERDRYEGVTPRSDVWAYGMTIYELMIGKVPYYRIKISATVMVAILRGELPSKPKSSEVRHDWRPEILDLMYQCWESRPTMRPTMSMVSAQMRSLRDASQVKSPVPESLLLAFDTPLSPVSLPKQEDPPDEEDVVGEATFIVESPEVGPVNLWQDAADRRDQAHVEFHLSAPPKLKTPIKRKSTAEESLLSRAEAGDALSALPEPKVPSLSRSILARPRSSSAPMAVPTQMTLTKPESPPPKLYKTPNTSQTSFGSISGRSWFSKPSRPVTPTTPVPDEPPSSASTSPVIKRKHRISSFWKKTSIEQQVSSPAGDSIADPIRNVHALLRRLIDNEEAMMKDTFDATFGARLRKGGSALVPLDRIDLLLTRLLSGYIRLRRQHGFFLKALKVAESVTMADLVPVVITLLSRTIETLGSVYPQYAFGIHKVEEELLEEMESNFPFRAWIQSSEEDIKLKIFLRKPLTSIETIFVSLTQLIPLAKLKCSKENAAVLGDLEVQLVSMLMKTRLRKWQGAMGQDDVVFNWRQLVLLKDSQAYADEARQSAIFKVIGAQMDFVRTLKVFHKGILRRIVHSHTSKVPHLQRIYSEMTILIDIHSQMLDGMHTHQINSHPKLTDIIHITFDSVSTWIDHYSIYSSVLLDALTELEEHSADLFPVVHAISHPLLVNQDMATLLWLPISHLRRFTKSLHLLLEVTPEGHAEMKTTVDVISVLSNLIDLCDSLTPSIGSRPEIRTLATQLIWQSEEDQMLGLDDPRRQVIHTGRPLMPQSETEGFLELFTILLDNSLIISLPRMRWGLSTFRVLYAATLENVTIMDHEVSEGHHDLYLLNGAHGETIAAPLTLRITTPKAPKTDVTLLCLTTMEAFEWRKHITAAKLAREDILETYTRSTLQRGDLIARTSFVPTCSAEFNYYGLKYYVIGGQNGAGLWIKSVEQNEPKQILSGVSIRQCSVLNSHGILLVLVGKSLSLFKLEDLVSGKVTSRQIDTKGSVRFFRMGLQGNRSVLVVVVSPYRHRVTVKIYDILDSGMGKGRRSSYFGIRDSWTAMFKHAADIVISHDLHDCTIMEDSLMLMGSDGFQFVALGKPDLNMQVFPVFKGLASSHTYQRCKTSKPINAFKFGNLILLCYSQFGLYVDDTGAVQGQSVEWNCEQVNQAFSNDTYLYLVSEEALEVRILQTGRRIDRIIGQDIRATRQEYSRPGQSMAPFHVTMTANNFFESELLNDDIYTLHEWNNS